MPCEYNYALASKIVSRPFATYAILTCPTARDELELGGSFSAFATTLLESDIADFKFKLPTVSVVSK